MPDGLACGSNGARMLPSIARLIGARRSLAVSILRPKAKAALYGRILPGLRVRPIGLHRARCAKFN